MLGSLSLRLTIEVRGARKDSHRASTSGSAADPSRPNTRIPRGTRRTFRAGCGRRFKAARVTTVLGHRYSNYGLGCRLYKPAYHRPNCRLWRRPDQRSGRTRSAGPVRSDSFDLDFGPGCLKLRLELLGVGLRQPGLHRLGSALDKIFRLFQTETGRRTNDLDDVDLVVADGSQDHVKLGLFFRRCGSGATAARGHHHRTAGGRLNSMNVLEVVSDLLRLQQRQAGNFVSKLLRIELRYRCRHRHVPFLVKFKSVFDKSQ